MSLQTFRMFSFQNINSFSHKCPWRLCVSLISFKLLWNTDETVKEKYLFFFFRFSSTVSESVWIHIDRCMNMCARGTVHSQFNWNKFTYLWMWMCVCIVVSKYRHHHYRCRRRCCCCHYQHHSSRLGVVAVVVFNASDDVVCQTNANTFPQMHIQL